MVRAERSCQGSAVPASAKAMITPNERADRLAAALRENLKKRKARARGADDTPSPLVSADGSRPTDQA